MTIALTIVARNLNLDNSRKKLVAWMRVGYPSFQIIRTSSFLG